MLLTETEAKEKWCPFARVAIAPSKAGVLGNRDLGDMAFIVGVGSANRVSGTVHDDAVALDVNNVSRCIASACMSWRRETGATAFERQRAGANPRGYCGLAGKP